MTNDPIAVPSRTARVGAVLGGYLIAALVAALAVRISHAGLPPEEAAGGMAAFGMAFMYLAVFCLLALIHSGILLCWLRGAMRPWWLALGAAAAALASFVLGFMLMAIMV